MRVTDGTNIWEVTGTIEQAYNTLEKAAERIGTNNYQAMGPTRRDRKGNQTGGYYVTAEHTAVMEAMSKVLSGEMRPEEAMALLYQHDTLQQRLGSS